MFRRPRSSGRYSIQISAPLQKAYLLYRINLLTPSPFYTQIIVGTLIEVGKGERRPEEMTAILESRDRTKAGATAAAQGLFLQEVEY